MSDKNDDLDLLEIPDVPPRTEGDEVSSNGIIPSLDELVAMSEMEVSPEASMQTDDLHSFVEQFYINERRDTDHSQTNVVKAEAPAVAISEAQPVIDKAPDTAEFAFGSNEASSESSGSMKVIGFAAAGVVVVALGGWGVLSMLTTQNPNSVESPATAISQPIQQPASSAEIVQPQTPTLAEQNNVTSTVAEDQPDARPSAVKTRPQTAELKTPKPNETKPTAKPEQKPKKKMTVDDLLN